MTGDDIDEAAKVLRGGGLVAYPTEAVYGLGCDPFDKAAVMRLLALKERDVAAGVLIIAAAREQLAPLVAPFTPEIEARVGKSWPGPVTWVVPASAAAPAWIRGRHSGIAVRVTAHPVAAELCRRGGMPLVSTSANLHGSPPARSAPDVRAMFGSRVDFVLEGSCGESDRPTTIVDALTGRVLREG
jgi:L-threonylcarbamoyladenylate synthase